MISDGWSSGIWNKELSELYNSFVNHTKPNLPELPIQYADYSVWQRQWLSGKVLDRQLSYWKEQLAGIPEEIQLSATTRPKEPSYKGAYTSCDIGEGLTKQLEAFALKQNMTPFTVALAAFAILMHRYSQQQDIVIGTPVANRSHTETENLIGFFVNTLVIRVRFHGLPTFQDICNQVKQTTLEAYHHQDVPFEQLVEHLKIERNLSRHPVFQIWFALDADTVLYNVKFVDVKISSYKSAKIEKGLGMT